MVCSTNISIHMYTAIQIKIDIDINGMNIIYSLIISAVLTPYNRPALSIASPREGETAGTFRVRTGVRQSIISLSIITLKSEILYVMLLFEVDG
jgi:hypothetical protein